jgi:hypothetical protein
LRASVFAAGYVHRSGHYIGGAVRITNPVAFWKLTKEERDHVPPVYLTFRTASGPLTIKGVGAPIVEVRA